MSGIEVTTSNGIQIIKFNRPEKKNAINFEMYKRLTDRLNSSAKEDSVLLTVLTGSGDYYSSGNDFSPNHITDKFIDGAVTIIHKFVSAFIDYPKLLIAVVNGPAIGIAATTLALCDIVYASDKAWFRTPFSKLGMVPEGCSTLTFPRIMGTAKASRLLYLNETMTSDEALSCGFVTQVFPHTRLTNLTATLIEEVAKLPIQSLKLSKQLVRGWDRDLLHRVNQEESKNLRERFLSEDFFNALLSFNKRKSKL